MSELAAQTVRLTVEYDGTRYHGWQYQPHAATVEGALREALHAVTGERPHLVAAGRTDAGAHAHGQVVAFTLEHARDLTVLRRALNATLPGDVSVLDAAVVPTGFHARYDAVARSYRYLVVPRRDRLAVARQYAWQVDGDLDLEAMRATAAVLAGRHDFAAFGRPPRPGGTTVRSVHRVEVRTAALVAGREERDRAVIIDVTADAFLYGMMRSIAAVLVDAGRGRLSAGEVAAMLREPGRARRPAPAPAHGLHQWTVIYPDAGDQDTTEENA